MSPDLPQWQDLALCAGSDSSGFISDETATTAVASARALCLMCPVAQACLSHALRVPETHGIWGGTTPAEREGILLGLAS